jgi:hypothetical protein
MGRPHRLSAAQRGVAPCRTHPLWRGPVRRALLTMANRSHRLIGHGGSEVIIREVEMLWAALAANQDLPRVEEGSAGYPAL